MKAKFTLTAISTAILAITASPGMLAEEIEAKANAEKDIEKIQITGSRIKRHEFSMPMPLVGLNKDDIDEIGTNDIADALYEIPSAVAGVSSQTSTTNIQNSGLNTADLRGLGDNRTLVLIDGRRTVSNSANGNRVSLGTIPSSFVDRVEVITGGASAVYGSDAVAGVVNIITEKGKEGLELDLRAARSNSLANEDYTFDLSWGASSANDKGYIFASLNFDKETAIRARNVSRSLLQADYRYEDGRNFYVNKLGDLVPVAEITPDQYGSLSSDPDGGRFDGSNFWYDDTGIQEGFETDRDGYDFRIEDDLDGARERLNLAIKANYEFDNKVEAFFTLIHSAIDTNNQREPEGDDYNDNHPLIDPVTFSATDFDAGRIALDNPYAPQQIVDAESSRGIRWDRRFVEVGRQLTENERETTRFWTGLRGTVFESEWDWETSVGYGRYKQNQIRFNEIDIVNLRHGLNAEQLADGTIQCADANARANGCVPVNLFGRGSITPEAADYIRANLAQEAIVEQFTAQGYMSGELFELPAGFVGAAFGFEYRKDEMQLKPDALNQRGGHSSGHVPAFTGDYDVTEAFAEISIPLLNDLPGVEFLNTDLSLRIADYGIDNIGTVASFGAGLQWSVIEGLNIRTSYQRALRAPDLTELFSPPRGDVDSFTDICDGVTLNSTGQIAQNCLSEPGITTAINQAIADGEEGIYEEESGSHSSPNAGNLGLKEEEATTKTIGFVWQPSFVDGLSLAADYYNIEIEDAIDSYTNTDILRQCYDSTSFGSDNPFCRDIQRNVQDGQLTNVIQRQFNLDLVETSGVDYQFNYELNLAPINLPGELELRYIHTHLIKYQLTSQGLDEVIIDDQKGELVHEKFEDRGRLSLTWRHNDWRVSWRTTYYGSSIDSRELQQAYDDAISEYETNIAAGEQGQLPEKPIFLDIDSELFHNVTLAYTHNFGDIKARFSTGVNNVFANEGPFLPTGDTESGGSHNVADAFGHRGRYVYARVNLTF